MTPCVATARASRLRRQGCRSAGLLVDQVFLGSDSKTLDLIQERGPFHPPETTGRFSLVSPMGAEGAQDLLALGRCPRELLARLRAVLRRTELDPSKEHLNVGGVSLDVGARQVTVDGKIADLTGIEFDLLLALMRRAGRVVPRASLLEHAGRSDVTVSDRTVDVHISHLRKKLLDDPPRLIKTVRGVGYVMAKGSE